MKSSLEKRSILTEPLPSKAAAADHYALLDSGAEFKLERFGPKLIARPSSLALWQKRLPPRWKEADAVFDPDRGWKFRGTRFEAWSMRCGEAQLELRLQNNGQVGIFPDHLAYLESLKKFAARLPTGARALNLYAYTGLATCTLAALGISVTHVDLSKTALSWAKRNLELSQVASDAVRLIPEDAIKFVERELRRGSKYDIIIADPPSFGRISKTQSWKLEEHIVNLMGSLVELCTPKEALLCITCHHSAFDQHVLYNLLADSTGKRMKAATALDLAIPEVDSQRSLPAGHCVLAELN